MAEPESPQARLDHIVVQIAAIMVAEVSSIYLSRPDDSLELFATEGLNPNAVHNTRLLKSEGLVGLIADKAEPINLHDARSHPKFSYRPETGEDPYNSFLGVPILRGGKLLGVLTIQNKAHRHYHEEEVEALQTTAMLLAELIASGEIANVDEVADDIALKNAQTLTGVGFTDGIALGHIVLHEPRVVVTKFIAEDITYERSRVRQALGKLRITVDELLSNSNIAKGEHKEVLDTYRMFAYDRGWGNRLLEAVSTGLTAEAAVERVQNDTRARMMRQTDPYLRERLHDLDDLSNRLLRILAGKTGKASMHELPDDTILVARDMGASELLDYNQTQLRGLILEEGSSTSHVIIVARALGIAVIGKVPNARNEVDQNNEAIVDAESGKVHIRPTPEIITAFSDKVRFRATRQQQYAQLRDKPAITEDGQKVKLHINAGLKVDLPHLVESGADGIGLFRTELQFMVASTFPRLKQQTETYKSIVEAADNKPVVFRTIDIGGDKVLPYLRHEKEENPAMGWRAVRIALDRPALFRTQVRALMHASAGRELRIMLPMITIVSEYEEARDLIDKELTFMRRHGHEEPTKILVGAMLEVPSLIWQLDKLLPQTDFISVGSNDLMQFIFAADRANMHISDRFDPLNPAFLRALRQIVVETNKHNVPLTLCGEMAGKPLETMALIGLGFRSISMAPASIGPVKSMLRSLNATEIEDYVLSGLDTKASSLRPDLEAFAKEKEIQI